MIEKEIKQLQEQITIMQRTLDGLVAALVPAPPKPRLGTWYLSREEYKENARDALNKVTEGWDVVVTKYGKIEDETFMVFGGHYDLPEE